MALAERLRSEFYSEQGELYRVSVWHEAYPGAVRTVETTGVTIDHEGTDTEVHNTVIPSYITIGIEIKTNPDYDIIEDLASSQEGEFIIKVLKDGQRYYEGVVLTDQVQVQDISYPLTFTIRATDGLGLLSEKYYNQTGRPGGTPYEGSDTIIKHIINCLNYTGNTSGFGAGETFLKTATEYWETAHVIGTGDSPLELSKIDHTCFWQVSEDSSGINRKNFKTVKEVLHQLCLFQLAQVFWSDGTYWVKQFDTHSAGSIEIRKWKTDGTSNGSETIDVEIDITNPAGDLTGWHRLAGGTFSYLQPIRKACITYRHDGLSNLVAGQTWNETESLLYDAGFLDNNSGSAGLKITGILRAEGVLVGPGIMVPAEVLGTFTHSYIFHLRISVGDYYLRSVPTSTALQWDLNPDSRIIIQTSIIELLTDYSLERLFTGVANEMPDSGNLLVQMELDRIVNGAGATLDLGDIIYTDPDGLILTLGNTWSFDNVDIQYLPDGRPDTQELERIYCVENETGGAPVTSSTDLDLGTVNFGDGPTDNSKTRLDVYVSTGPYWQQANTWQNQAAGKGYAIWQLVLVRLMALRQNSLRLMQGPLFGDIQAHTVLNYDSAKWVMLRISRNLETCQVNGTWFAYSVKSTTALVVPPFVPIVPAPPPFSGPYIPPYVPGPATEPGGTETLRVGAITRLTEGTTAGSFIERLAVEALPGTALDEGESIRVTHPVMGYTQVFTLARTAFENDTFIEVSEIAAVSFPAGAIVNKEAADTGTRAIKDRDLIRGIARESSSSNPEGYAAVITDLVIKTAEALGVSGAPAGMLLDESGIKFYKAGTAGTFTILNASSGASSWPAAVTIAGKLTANGGIDYDGSIVDLTPDYVFSNQPKVADMVAHVRQHSALPGMPTLAEIKAGGTRISGAAGGFDLVKLVLVLWEKIEESHLYIAQLHEQLNNRNDAPNS